MRFSIILLFTLHALHSLSQADSLNLNWLIPSGHTPATLATATDAVRGKTYIAGDFDKLQSQTPYNTTLDLVSDEVLSPKIKINGEIRVAISDGNGGFFIGGNFTKVNDQALSYLAHIDQNNNIVPFNVQVNQMVFTLLLENGVLYIGGNFTNINGSVRNFVAAVDSATGILTSWNPNPNNLVLKMHSSGGSILMCGNFTNIGGIARNYFCAVNPISGVLNSWNPNPNQNIFNIEEHLGFIYLIGNYSSISGELRDGLSRYDALTLNLDTWDYGITNGLVSGLCFSGSTMYMYGFFNGIDGFSRQNIAVYDLNTLSVLPNLLNVNEQVLSGEVINGKVYFGGEFTTLNSAPRYYLFRADANTAVVDIWDPKPSNFVKGFISDGVHMFLFGIFGKFGTQSASNLITYDTATGQPSTEQILLNGAVNSLKIEGNLLFLAGHFTEVNGQARNRMAIIDLTTGTLSDWNFNGFWDASNFNLHDNRLYFSHYNQVSSVHLYNDDDFITHVNLLDNNGQSSDAHVYDMSFSNDTLIVVGRFYYINGIQRNSFALFDYTNDQVLALNPAVTFNSGGTDYYGTVNTVTQEGAILYVGGMFDKAFGQTRKGLFSVNMSSSASAGIGPLMYGQVTDLEIRTDGLTVAGAFNLGALNRTNLVKVNLANNNLINWAPNPNSLTNMVKVLEGITLAFGTFSSVDSTLLEDIAIFENCLSFSSTTISTTCNYLWNGITYTESGVYEKNLINASGCDSVAYLNLEIQNSFSSQTVQICSASYTSGSGIVYNQTGLYTELLTNVYGCDSVAWLDLEFYPTYDTTISFLNYTSSYTWPLNGQTYTQTGIYDHTLQTINGCDSIIHLNLLFVPSPESNEILNNWVANGDIYDIDYDSLNNRMILGGNFTGFSRKGSGPKLLDESTGFPTDFVPTHDEFITQVISDGSNGYFVIGGFTIIGDSLRDNIAHLDSNYNVTAWHADGPANFTEIIIGGNYLFGRTFNDVKALDITTGNVLSWTVSAYGGDNIYTMEYIDGYLYIGGDFTLLIAPTLIPKKALAQIDPTTGIPTSWNPFSSGTPIVYDIHADGNKLYFGGTFGFFSGWTRNRVARATVIGSSLTVDSWNPNANADVYSIQTSSTKVLILGAFTTMAGSSRQGVAYINKANTTLHSFNPGTGLTSSFYYTAAKFLNGNLYIQFADPDVTIGSSKRSYLASFDTINFQLRSWVVNPNTTAEIEVANGKLIVCGPYNFIGYIDRPLIAAVDPSTLDILNWNPTVAGTVVTEITIAGNKLFVSGNIIYNSGSFYEGIQVFNLSTGVSIATPEQINGNGQLLDYNNGFVYASRFYGDITSPPNWSFCRIDTSSLNFDMTFDLAIASTSNPSYESVLDCEFVDSLMYFSGNFEIVQGQTRSGVASMNLNTLQLTPFSISMPGFNIYIELFEDNLIILGPYDTINSQPRSYLSSVNRFNGNLSSWYPNFNQPPFSYYSLNSLEIKDNFIYVGGDYNYGSQIQRYGLASFSLNSNYPTALTFSQFSTVNDLCFSNDRLHAVGDLLSPSNVSLIEKHKVFDICNLEIDEYDTTFNSTNYTWNGILCQQSGLYFYSVDNPTGCDSNYILHLTILPAIEVNQTLVKCNSYTWPINSQTYTTTGIY